MAGFPIGAGSSSSNKRNTISLDLNTLTRYFGKERGKSEGLQRRFSLRRIFSQRESRPSTAGDNPSKHKTFTRIGSKLDDSWTRTEEDWAQELGQANFTITPSPYLPYCKTLSTADKFWSDLQQAKDSFERYQAEVHENYGATSRVYQLTREKWSEVDKQWIKYANQVTLETGTTLNGSGQSVEAPQPTEKMIAENIELGAQADAPALHAATPGLMQPDVEPKKRPDASEEKNSWQERENESTRQLFGHKNAMAEELTKKERNTIHMDTVAETGLIDTMNERQLRRRAVYYPYPFNPLFSEEFLASLPETSRTPLGIIMRRPSMITINPKSLKRSATTNPADYPSFRQKISSPVSPVVDRVLKGDSQAAYNAPFTKVTETDLGQRFAKTSNNVIATNVKQLPIPPSPMEQARFFQDAAIEQSKRRLAGLTKILTRTPHMLAQERGWPSQHQIFEHSSQVPLIVRNFLGNGSLGVVEEVRHKDNARTFVRKKVLLPYPSRKQRLKIMEQEAKALRSLTHPHIVKILGSYQDGSKNGNRCYSLLIWPVGQSDLKTFLEATGAKTKLEPGQLFQSRELMWLRTWFKCLASALAYMHSKGIRHQDIKPSNIIHRQGQVFFTDFSSSSQFRVGHTTSTENPARISQMYAAPEVCRLPGESPQYNRHGLSTEIFSLGCVFAEMLTVADGRRLQDYDGFHEYCAGTARWDRPRGLDTENFQPILLYGRATDRIHEWFANSAEATTILMYGKCIQPMLAVDRANRPSAVQVEELLQRHQPWLNLACPCQNALPSTN